MAHAAGDVVAGGLGRILLAGAAMKELTAKQQRVWDLRESGMTVAQVALEVGTSAPVVSKMIGVCRAKLGMPKMTPEQGRALGGGVPLHVSDPEKFVTGMDVLSEPKLVKLREALQDAGISGKAATAYIHRLRRRYPGVLKEAKALKTAALVDLMGEKIHMALAAMDEHVILEASYRDLALGVSALIEKQQLLKGQPTAITSDLERKKLVELLPLLTAEAARRGITIEGTAERVIQQEA